MEPEDYENPNLAHAEEAMMALGLALDEAIEYIIELTETLCDLTPRSIVQHMPLVMQATHFVREWGADDR